MLLCLRLGKVLEAGMRRGHAWGCTGVRQNHASRWVDLVCNYVLLLKAMLSRACRRFSITHSVVLWHRNNRQAVDGSRSALTQMEGPRKRHPADASLSTRAPNGKKARLTEEFTWIKEKAAYRDWVDGAHGASSVLWIRGTPGCGKTFLAQHFPSLLSRAPGKPTVARYLCDANTTPTDIARSICDQLQDGRAANNLDDEVEELLTSMNMQEHYTANHAHTAWDALDNLLDNLRTWTLVIDGLDELSTKWLAVEDFGVLHRLLQIVDDHRGASKLCILSRPDSRIAKVFDSSLQIDITPSETEGDVRMLIEDRVGRSELLRPHREVIVETLLAKSHGNFLWVRVALDMLAHERSTDDLMPLLESLPDTMNELYAALLVRQNQCLTPAHIALRNAVCRWKLLSFRDLSVQELANAVAVSTNAFVADIKTTIDEVCYGLVTVEKGEVEPVHHSLREFCTVPEARSTDFAGVHDKAGHTSIAICCLQYLLHFNDAPDTVLPVAGKSGPAVSMCPLFQYASLYWIDHVSLGYSDDVKLKGLIEHFFSNPISFAWMDILLPRFMEASVLPVPPRPRDAARFAFLFSLKAKLLSTIQDAAEKNRLDHKFSECVATNYEQALSEAVSSNGDSSKAAIARMLDLGEVYGWLPGRRARSEELISNAFEDVEKMQLTESANPDDIKLRVQAYQAQTDSLKRAGKYEQAKTLLETLLQIIESHSETLAAPGANPPDQMFALDSLGWVCMRLNLFDEAAPHLEQAVQLATKFHGSTSPHTSRSKLTLAEVLVKLGRTQEAEALCEPLIEALQQHKVNGVPLSRDSVSQLNVLAAVYAAQKRYADAVAAWEVVVDDRVRAFGGEHAMTLWATMQLGLAVERAGREERDVRRAVALFEELLPRQERVLGGEHPDVGTSREALARLQDEEWLVVEVEE